MRTIYSADIVLQKTGKDKYFIRKTKFIQNNYKPNDCISYEDVILWNLLGYKIVVIDWNDNIIQKYNI